MIRKSLSVILFCLCATALFGCASTPEQHGNGFTFTPANGASYQSATAGEVIQKKYNLEKKPGLILVATQQKDTPAYKKQMHVLARINADHNQYMLVIANAAGLYTAGYHTSRKTARHLLAHSDFRVIVLDGDGKRLANSTQPLSRQKLLRLLNKTPQAGKPSNQ